MNERTSQQTPFADHFLTVKNIRLRYWQAGERGSPVLLFHGLNGCVENWRWNIGALAERHRVIALDGPGHGLSQPDDRTFNLNFTRELVVEFLQHFGVERTSIAALSGGGLIALKCVLDRPAMVDKLVLVDVAGLGRDISPRMRLLSMLPPPPPQLFNRRLSRNELQYWLHQAFFQNPQALTEPMLDDFFTNIGREHTMRTATRLMRWGVNLWGQKHVFRSRLRHIQAPTLIVWGKQDKLIPVSHAYAAARRIPNARLIVFDPCGHLPMLEHTADFNREVSAFLDG